MSKTEDFCVPENLVPQETKTIISPSGKYSLTVFQYKTSNDPNKRTWNYSKGVVKNIQTEEIVSEICRNYPGFEHLFFQNRGREWMITGKTYTSQCFIDLDNGNVYDNKDETSINDLCWTQMIPNASGTILAVSACFWGGPFEYYFFDISKPEDGWPMLKYTTYDPDYYLLIDEDYSFVQWIDERHFEYRVEKTIDYFCDTDNESNNNTKDNSHDDSEEIFPAYKYIVSFNDEQVNAELVENNPSYSKYVEKQKLAAREHEEYMAKFYKSDRIKAFDILGKVSIMFHNKDGYFFGPDTKTTHFTVEYKKFKVLCDEKYVLIYSGENFTFDTVDDAIEEIKKLEANYVC